MAKKRPMKLDDLFRMKAVGKAAISPDGARIAYELTRFDLKQNKNFTQLMLVNVEDGRSAELTTGDHNDRLPRWSPDGSRLAFLSDRDKGTCLFVLPMFGGEAKRITEPDGFVKDFAWSPDGRKLAYAYQPMNDRQRLERDGKDDEIKKRPQYKHITRLFHKLDGTGWWNGQRTHIWTISATGGKPKQITRGDYDDREPRFSPDGKLVSFISNRVEDPDKHFDNGDIYVVKPTGGAIKKLTQMPGSCNGHAWSPDGKWIAFIGDPAPAGQWWKYNAHVWAIPSTGGKARELTKEIDNHCVNVTLGDVAVTCFESCPPLWSSDGSRLYFLVSEGGACRVYSQSFKGSDLRCELGGFVNVGQIQRSANDGPIAIVLGTGTNPADVFVAEADAMKKPRQLTQSNADLFKRIHVSEPEPFKVSSGKVQVHGWVIKPPNFNARRKYPAILEIHGGPHAQYGACFFHEKQFLAAQGYVVVLSNPRGSCGYGLDFQRSIHADWGGYDYRDLMKVTDWMARRPYVDSKRLGVTGGSYGGYMTNWIVGHTDRFKAAVTQRSVVNLESMFGTSDFGYDLGSEFGGLPWKTLKRYRAQSPLTFAPRIKTPLLIEHEEEDHRCPIEQAEQLFATLKVLGRPVELIRFEGESHGLSRGGRPQNRAERLRRIAGWFERYL